MFSFVQNNIKFLSVSILFEIYICSLNVIVVVFRKTLTQIK